MSFIETIKHCKCCGKLLQLNCNRDIDRKNFCSGKCRNNYSWKVRFSNPATKICTVCGKEFKPTNNSQKNCSTKCTASKQVERSYKYLNDNLEAYLKHLLYKKERSNLPLEHMLDLYKIQGGKCAISGIELTLTKQVNAEKVHTNLSIDRIDSSKGYEIGNVQLVCAIVNIMKSTLTTKELLWWCEKMVNNNASK